MTGGHAGGAGQFSRPHVSKYHSARSRETEQSKARRKAQCADLSSHRLSDEVFPATYESGNARGTAEFTTMPSVKRQFKATELWTTPSTRAARGGEGSESEENTRVSTWTGKQLVETTQALDEPRHHTAKTV